MEKMQNKIVSVHIPKCGGSSFTKFLKQTYGDALFLDYGISWAQRAGVQTSMNGKTRCIHGHFQANKYDNSFAPFKLITWLRHPVERVISNYYYILRHPELRKTEHPQSPAITVLENNLPLIEYARLPYAQRMIEWIFARKKISDFYFIGIVEHYAESLHKFCEMMGLECPSEVPVENANIERGNSRYNIDKDEYSEIARLNPADMKIYEEALSLWKK